MLVRTRQNGILLSLNFSKVYQTNRVEGELIDTAKFTLYSPNMVY